MGHPAAQRPARRIDSSRIKAGSLFQIVEQRGNVAHITHSDLIEPVTAARQRGRSRISRTLRETQTISRVPDTSSRPPSPFRKHIDEAVPIARSVSERLSYSIGRSVAAVEKENDGKACLRAGLSLRQVILVDPTPAINGEGNLRTVRSGTSAICGVSNHRERCRDKEERNYQLMKAHSFILEGSSGSYENRSPWSTQGRAQPYSFFSNVDDIRRAHGLLAMLMVSPSADSFCRPANASS